VADQSPGQRSRIDAGVPLSRSTQTTKTKWSRFTGLLPRRSDYAGLSTSWRSDLVAGVTVGVVALPLALAFGIATGLGAEAGLITAIVAGLVAAVFGGSNVQVSGPTGAMTVVLVPIVARDGVDAVFLVGLLAGILLTLAALARLGRYLTYVPWPVIEGFTVGIAVLIFLQQVPNALGVAKPAGENSALVAGRAVAASLSGGNLGALGLVALTAVVMIVGPRLHRSVPGSLLAVAVSTVVASVAGLDVTRIGSLPGSLPLPSMPTVDLDRISALFPAALAVAALAGLESLLSAKVADGMQHRERHDPDRELFGQGLANVVSPLFGGIPATGAVARTAVNVRSGAWTRASAMVHSLVLIGVVFLGGGLVARIPLAALAGVLMVTAVRMVELRNVRAILCSTRSDAAVLGMTAAATIVFDLVVAVALGIAVAAVLVLRKVALSSRVTAEAGSEQILTFSLDGVLFFGATQRFLRELAEVGGAEIVILRLPRLHVLDATGAHALVELIDELHQRGVDVLLKGPRPEHLRVLEAAGVFKRLPAEDHLFEDIEVALDHARRSLATR